MVFWNSIFFYRTYRRENNSRLHGLCSYAASAGNGRLGVLHKYDLGASFPVRRATVLRGGHGGRPFDSVSRQRMLMASSEHRVLHYYRFELLGEIFWYDDGAAIRMRAVQ